MKIVFASTPVQEGEICRLVDYMYTHVFPHYYLDREISQFKKLKILDPSNNSEFSTLKDAFEVLASLQTVISILELPVLDEEYSTIFNINVRKLQSFDLFFPFEFDQFSQKKDSQKYVFSVYTKAANEMLI